LRHLIDLNQAEPGDNLTDNPLQSDMYIYNLFERADLPKTGKVCFFYHNQDVNYVPNFEKRRELLCNFLVGTTPIPSYLLQDDLSDAADDEAANKIIWKKRLKHLMMMGMGDTVTTRQTMVMMSTIAHQM
jgi:hypothetical protein